MIHINCQKTEALLSTRSLDGLMAHERESVSAHLESCESCRQFKETAELLSAACPAVEPPQMDPLQFRRIARAATDGRLPEGFVPRERGLRLVPLISLAAALIIGVAAMFWLNGGSLNPVTDPRPASNSASTQIASKDTPVSANEWQFTEQDAEVSVSASSRVWGSPGTVLHRDASAAADVRLRMSGGQIVADVDHLRHTGAFVVQTPRCDVEVRGTLFSVTVEPGGREVIRVINGRVAVTERAHPESIQVLDSGQEFVTGMKTPRGADEADLNRDLIAFAPTEKSSGTPAKRDREPQAVATGSNRLSELARAYRKAREFEKAEETYERLFKEYPSSGAALDAHVALGQLELTALNDSAGALQHFSRYLEKKPSGYLSEEARVGIAGVHRKNNDHNAVIAATTDYLQQHRRGMYSAEMLLARANAYQRIGDCDAAVADFETIMRTFPGTAQAKAAARKSDQCTGKAP